METTIPDRILDVIGADCGCFIERQNDHIYRIYPTTLDKSMDNQNIREIQQKLRSSIHKLNIPYPWCDNESLKKLLFIMRRAAIAKNLSFKTGGYFWYDPSDKDTQDTLDNEYDEDGDIDIMDYEEDISDGGHIWAYQNCEEEADIDYQRNTKHH